jgi:hypothetical protein
VARRTGAIGVYPHVVRCAYVVSKNSFLAPLPSYYSGSKVSARQRINAILFVIAFQRQESIVSGISYNLVALKIAFHFLYNRSRQPTGHVEHRDFRLLGRTNANLFYNTLNLLT